MRRAALLLCFLTFTSLLPMAAKSSTKPTSKSATPKAAAKAAPSPASSNKKRVRVVEGEDDESASAAVSSSTRSGKQVEKKAAGATVEKRDLRDKAKDLSAIEPIVSSKAPKPSKSALKKAAPAEEEEISLDNGEDDAEEEIDFLKGFEESGDEGEDSSDEEMEGDDAEEFKVEALPKVNGKDEASVQKKLEAKAERRKNVSRPVLRRCCRTS